jgi:hypothetical protein
MLRNPSFIAMVHPSLSKREAEALHFKDLRLQRCISYLVPELLLPEPEPEDEPPPLFEPPLLFDEPPELLFELPPPLLLFGLPCCDGTGLLLVVLLVVPLSHGVQTMTAKAMIAATITPRMTIIMPAVIPAAASPE